MPLIAEKARTVRLDEIAEGFTATQARLIVAGERLLGEQGFAGAALHRIAQAAGQANTYAVQY